MDQKNYHVAPDASLKRVVRFDLMDQTDLEFTFKLLDSRPGSGLYLDLCLEEIYKRQIKGDWVFVPIPHQYELTPWASDVLYFFQKGLKKRLYGVGEWFMSWRVKIGLVRAV